MATARRERGGTAVEEQAPDGGGAGPRVAARILAAVLGIAAAVATFVVTWRDRSEVDDPVLRAPLHQGLYTERLFVLGCVLVIITAISIGTRTGE